MLFEGMLAKTLEIIGSIRRDILKALAFTFIRRAWRFLPYRIHIVMLLKFMIAKTFSLWAYHFAVILIVILPREV
jgi:hypothetical protein